MYKIMNGSMNVKVTPNLHVCPPGKKIVHALFLRKTPQRIYSLKGDERIR